MPRSVKAHGKKRVTCKICGKKHSTSKHNFHGVGSYIDSHSVKTLAKAINKAQRKRRKR